MFIPIMKLAIKTKCKKSENVASVSEKQQSITRKHTIYCATGVMRLGLVNPSHLYLLLKRSIYNTHNKERDIILSLKLNGI